MDAIDKFLKRKSKTEYQTRRGAVIRLSKDDKEKIRKFKAGRSLVKFVVQRPMECPYVRTVLEEPLVKQREHSAEHEEKKRAQTEHGLQAARRKRGVERERKRKFRQKREPEDVEQEDIWEGREGTSLSDQKRMYAKPKLPSSGDSYRSEGLFSISDLKLTREELWRAVHFHRDLIRAPRMLWTELEARLERALPKAVKVPKGLKFPETAVKEIAFSEGVKGVFFLRGAMHFLVLLRSSVAIVDAEGYLPPRRLHITSAGKDVAIRAMVLSPDTSRVALLLVSHGFLSFAVQELLCMRKPELHLELGVEEGGSCPFPFVHMFDGKTFKGGAWHRKNMYFAGVIHGKVVFVNVATKKSLLFFNGSEKAQCVAFHPMENTLLVVAPSNVHFIKIQGKRMLKELTIQNVPGASSASLSLGHELLLLGTISNSVQAYKIARDGTATFVRSIYTSDTPLTLETHSKFPYSLVFDGRLPVLLYSNMKGDAQMLPDHRVGVICRYSLPYRSASFHPTLPMGVFAVENRVHLLVPRY